jgi:hypothetical protein
VVSDPQSTNTMVNLRNFYLVLRTASGSFDTYTTGTARAGGTVFTGPTVYVYVSDNVRPPAAGTARGQSSVWTELLTMTPAATPSYTGLTTVGQTFTDPTPGGATITLRAISATGATVEVSRPGAAATAAVPTCLDGTALRWYRPACLQGDPTGLRAPWHRWRRGRHRWQRRGERRRYGRRPASMPTGLAPAGCPGWVGGSTGAGGVDRHRRSPDPTTGVGGKVRRRRRQTAVWSPVAAAAGPAARAALDRAGRGPGHRSGAPAARHLSTQSNRVREAGSPRTARRGVVKRRPALLHCRLPSGSGGR